MSKKKKTLLAVALLLVLVIGALTAYCILGPKANDNSAGIGIHVTVYHGDGSEKTFDIRTESENLRGALEQEKLVSGEEGEFGLFVQTVDGETVNAANEEWWNITKSGEMLMTGVEDTMIADGDSYEFTFTVGYDAFG